jgi:predicted RNase H-like nuclease (RuvC/YqgF family)
MTIRKFIALVAGLVFLGGPLFGQSLGDVGRAQRQKQGDASTSQPAKVITNDDLGTSSSDSSHTRTKEKKDPKPEQKEEKFEKDAEHTKAAILAQKIKITNLQAEIEKLRASIRYIETGVPSNENQLKKQQAADHMQEQLRQENQRLAAMQEAARRAGFGSVVYDP